MARLALRPIAGEHRGPQPALHRMLELMGEVEARQGYPVVLGGELRAPFGIDQSGGAAWEVTLGWFHRG